MTYPHFISEETEAQVLVICPRPPPCVDGGAKIPPSAALGQTLLHI